MYYIYTALQSSLRGSLLYLNPIDLKLTVTYLPKVVFSLQAAIEQDDLLIRENWQ